MAKKDKGEVKTNAMRILDRAGVSYEHFSYECDEFVDGAQTADHLGLPHEKVFKTLVTVAPDREHYVFVIPIDEELDLKKAARAAGEKSVEMIHQKELLPNTGYIHGGCSPVGMKKLYATVIDASAEALERIYVSGGKIGTQVGVNPKALAEFIGAAFADITR